MWSSSVEFRNYIILYTRIEIFSNKATGGRRKDDDRMKMNEIQIKNGKQCKPSLFFTHSLFHRL